MKWHIDPPYDALQELRDCQQQIQELNENSLQIARAVNEQSTMILELLEQNRLLWSMIKDLNRHS
jgi:hypothetical protein